MRTAFDREDLKIWAALSNQRQRSIRAMPDADFRKRASAPTDDGSEHIIDPVLELRTPESWQLSGGVEMEFEVKHRVEAGIFAGFTPRLAHAHGASPSVLQGKAGEDVDETLVGQLRPVGGGKSP